MTKTPRFKPRQLGEQAREPSQRDLDELASTAKVREDTEESPTPAQLRQAQEVAFTLTLDPEMIADIERLRKRPLKLSRRAWIRLAIAEKIARDKEG